MKHIIQAFLPTGQASQLKGSLLPGLDQNCPAATKCPPNKSDQLLFGGMEPSLHSPCCIKRMKGDRGCCGTVSDQEFFSNYQRRIEETWKKNGKRPDIDRDVQKILNRAFPHKAYKPQTALLKTTQKKPLQSLPAKILLAPYRFLKWLIIGFLKDMKLLLNP